MPRALMYAEHALALWGAFSLAAFLGFVVMLAKSSKYFD